MSSKKASDADLVAAYADLKSVWAVGARFKMAGQTVHDRLSALGAVTPPNVLTEADKNRLLAEYPGHAANGTLATLAASMGRTKHYLCRHARALGLTNQRRKKAPHVAAAASERARNGIVLHGHPRGMKGKTHSAETKAHLSGAMTRVWGAKSQDEKDAVIMAQARGRRAAGTTPRGRPETSWKAAWREVGGKRIFFRSRWEANYARYLEWLRVRGEIQSWEHEPETFWFEGIRRGAMSYLPDFKVTENSGAVAWHEVKGWMDSRSKTKIARMARYFPKVRLIVIDSKSYKSIARQMAPMIDGWE